MKNNFKILFSFFLSKAIKFLQKHPSLKAYIFSYALKHPSLIIQLRGLAERKLKNQKKINKFPVWLQNYPLLIQNNYIYIKTVFDLRAKTDQVVATDIKSPLLKLAFVSPLPPQRSGICTYSTQILAELVKYYQIEVITLQETTANYPENASYNIRTPDWLYKNFHLMDRIIYQLGNSDSHSYMKSLMEKIPGIVVLHDFYLSGLYSYLELIAEPAYAWAQELYYAHGFKTIKERYTEKNIGQLKLKYPVNLRIIQNSIGVIVHSEYSKQLAKNWYGETIALDWQVIPHLRFSQQDNKRVQSRQLLGLKENDFLLCSFGFLSAKKLSQRILKSWAASGLAQDEQFFLAFVGENDPGLYGQELLAFINNNSLKDRVRITGWADDLKYTTYLAAADMAVQLRTLSQGESSGSLLDCLNYGIPTIVNAHGTFAELPADVVYSLPDNFSDAELIEALEILYKNKQQRSKLSNCGQNLVRTLHSPAGCAKMYVEAIEHFYQFSQSNSAILARTISQTQLKSPTDYELINLAESIYERAQSPQGDKQILLDITATHAHDLKTGIERVVRGLMMELLQATIPGYRVEPVYLSQEGGRWHYKYARQYTLVLLNCPVEILEDDVVAAHPADLLLILDLSGNSLINSAAAGLHAQWRRRGVKIYALIHDILPVLLPQYFPLGADELHARWLREIAQFDGAVCISKAVASEFSIWLEKNQAPQNQHDYQISWSHHGADIPNSAPSLGIPDGGLALLDQISKKPSFLMVGTIEPRKMHLQAIEAFSLLWKQGIDVNLIIVGAEGWVTLPDGARRSIPETIHCLRTHAETGRHLFWLSGVSDEYLEKIYAACSCLLINSAGEGFGLPLIEAARQKLPIIARDLSVFREIAGEYAGYFSAKTPEDLANAIKAWLALYHAGKHPRSEQINWLTWKQSAENLVRILLNIEKENINAEYSF